MVRPIEKQPETPSTTSQEELTTLIGSFPILAIMKQKGIPLTREHYLALMVPNHNPSKPLHPELEMELPEPFQMEYDLDFTVDDWDQDRED